MATVYKLKRKLTAEQGDKLASKFLDDTAYDTLIDHDADGYDMNGNLLFKFRKGVVPLETLKLGYESFKDSIVLTDGRGMASGGYHKRLREDGSESNISISNKVQSGNVGYMDKSSMVHYCRKTAFSRKYFDKFTQGVPFVKAISDLYEELAPEHFKFQQAVVRGTNQNYLIPGTVFTTVTVNKNFQTSVHKDAGDYPKGFGNLIIYREGEFTGCYFCMPEYGIAVDLQNTDALFADVHRWHGNTPFHNLQDPAFRVAFVMYFREYMMACKSPSEELLSAKKTAGGYLRL